MEVLGTSFLKDTNGFTKFYPSLFCVVVFCVCLYLMSHVMKVIPVGVTYASFAGLCIIATVLVGIFKFNQTPNLYTNIGLAFIIIGVLMVNLIGKINN